MVDCRMLTGPLAGNIVSVAAEDAAAGLNDGWAAPVALFTSYPWPWDVDRSLIAEPNPPTYDEWVEAGSPPGAPHGPPQPVTPPVLSSISPTTAQIGTGPHMFTLTGTNFTPMSKAFAQVAAMPDSELETTFVSTTKLDAVMNFDPAAAGDVGIVVKQGENVTSAQTVTFEAAEPPANSAPTDITLTPSTVAETALSGDEVGTLATVDADAGDTFTYELLSDASGLFVLANTDKIHTNAALTAGDQVIRVRTTDSGGLTFEKDITITVTAAE
jgi:hypothetical protein